MDSKNQIKKEQLIDAFYRESSLFRSLEISKNIADLCFKKKQTKENVNINIENPLQDNIPAEPDEFR